MQIALSNEIFLLDLLNFFHTCDSKTIQERLANRLFDDDHVTLLCKIISISKMNYNLNKNKYLKIFRLWF